MCYISHYVGERMVEGVVGREGRGTISKVRRHFTIVPEQIRFPSRKCIPPASALWALALKQEER